MDSVEYVCVCVCVCKSGTPFPNERAVSDCAQFLSIDFTDIDEYDTGAKHINWDNDMFTPLGHVLHLLMYNHC